jgi:GntR family transcriptional regulator
MTRESSSPLHEQIADALRTAIESGEYPPGSALPSEAQLRTAWKVSRGPVRHAIQSLASQGYVRKSQGKAATVRSRPVVQSADSYTPFSRWAQSIGRTYGQRTASFSMHPADEVAAERLGIAPGDRVFEMTRLRLLDDRPCMVERSTFTTRAGALLMKFDLDGEGISDYLAENGVHYAIVEQRLDAVAADETDAELLGVPAGTPLLRVTRLSSGDDGIPWEYSEDRYRPDLVTFQTSYTRVAQA